MAEQGHLNIDDQTTKFCVSFVLVRVAGHGLSLFVEAWNLHHISGRSC